MLLLPRRGTLARRRLVAATALALAIMAFLVDPRAAALVGAAAGPGRVIDGESRPRRRPRRRRAFGRGVTLDPSRPKTLTLVTDSVTLGAAGRAAHAPFPTGRCKCSGSRR